MIKNIHCSDGHLVVNPTYPPYVNQNVGSGAIRWDGPTQTLQVWDGHTWLQVSGCNATVELSQSTREAVEWAKSKMLAERQINTLSAENSSVRDALAQLTKAREQLDIIVALVKNGSKENV